MSDFLALTFKCPTLSMNQSVKSIYFLFANMENGGTGHFRGSHGLSARRVQRINQLKVKAPRFLVNLYLFSPIALLFVNTYAVKISFTCEKGSLANSRLAAASGKVSGKRGWL